MTKKLWAKVPGFPDYEVSNHGEVHSLRVGIRRPLKTNASKHAFPSVHLTDPNGYAKKVYLKNLILRTFGNAETQAKVNDRRLCVVHRDGDYYNCHIDNLKFVSFVDRMRATRAKNLADKKKEEARLRKHKADQILEGLPTGPPIMFVESPTRFISKPTKNKGETK